MNFTKLLGGYEFGPEGVEDMGNPVPQIQTSYSCVTGSPVDSGACAYANPSDELDVVLADLEIAPGLIFWPSFVTVTGPTLGDVSPAPDWVQVGLSWNEFIYFSFDGDAETGAPTCQVNPSPPPDFTCGPRVENQPEVNVVVDYDDWRFYDTGTYETGDLHYVDPDVTTNLDADPTNPYQIGDTPSRVGLIVPPADYANVWVPPSGEAFPENADKLWAWGDAAGLRVRWYTRPDGEMYWSKTVDNPGAGGPGLTGVSVGVVLFWEIESGAPGEITAGVIGRGVRSRDRIAGRVVTP